MRILIHSYVPIYPYYDGAGLRIFNVTPFITERHTCDLIQERWLWESMDKPLSPECSPNWLEKKYRQVWNIHHKKNEKLLYGFIWHSQELQQLLNKLLIYGAYDVMWSGNDTLPIYLSGNHLAQTPILISPTDSMHLYYRRQLRQLMAFKRKLRSGAKWALYTLYQIREMNKFHNWTMVAERDAENMHRLSPQVNIEVIPNGVDVDRFISKTETHQPCEAIFVGTLGASTTNEIAVIWFMQNVWMNIVKCIPEARFTIVGRNPSPELKSLSKQLTNVNVTGYVIDTRIFYWQAGIFVLPMQSGAGIKNKLLESWAAGCAVVTNSLGIEGVKHVQHGKNVLVADEPDQMANMVLGLMLDPERQRELGEHGRLTARKWYSWEKVAEQIEDHLISIVKRREQSSI